MSDATLNYNLSEQLVILWCCLGAGGFLSIVVFCCCRFISQRPNGLFSFPPSEPPAIRHRQLQQIQVFSKHPAPILTTSARQAAAVFENKGRPQSHHASLNMAKHDSLPQHIDSQRIATQRSPRIIQCALQVSSPKDAEIYSDPMVQEMMAFTQKTLMRAGVFPGPVSTSDRVSSARAALNTEPPANAAEAILEMTRYTSGVMEAMSLDLSHYETSAV
jgi:hypothetical protein